MDLCGLSLHQAVAYRARGLSTNVRDVLQVSLQPGTWSQYDRGIRLYQAFLVTLPANSVETSDEIHMLHFADFLMKRGYKPSSVMSVWTAVRKWRAILSFPVLDGELMALFARGAKRSRQLVAKQRRPFPVSSFHECWLQRSSLSRTLRLRLVMCALAFVGMFRGATISVLSLLDFHVIKQRRFLRSITEGFVIRFTEKHGNLSGRVLHFVSPFVAEVYTELLDLIPCDQFSTSFADLLHSSSPVSWLRDICDHFDLKPVFGIFDFHSLRFGAASNAIVQGVDRTKVQADGGWLSQAQFESDYVDPDYEFSVHGSIYCAHLFPIVRRS